MRVTIIGCGDAFGSGGRFQAATLVEIDGEGCLVDCGATTQTALAAREIDPDGIASILITHLHGDHFGGIPFFLLDAQWVRRRTRPLVLAGPPGMRERTLAALDIFYPDALTRTPWTFDWQIVEIEPDRTEPVALGSFSVRTASVLHPSGAPATAVRLEAKDRVFAHSGDTQWTEALPGILSGADLAFVDCYGYDVPTPMHMDYVSLLPRRSQIRAKRVALTHMGPSMLKHLNDVDRSLFDVANDGRVYNL